MDRTASEQVLGPPGRRPSAVQSRSRTASSSPPSRDSTASSSADLLAQHPGQVHQDGVTDGMAVRVVDRLERVDVDEHQRGAGADRPGAASTRAPRRTTRRLTRPVSESTRACSCSAATSRSCSPLPRVSITARHDEDGAEEQQVGGRPAPGGCSSEQDDDVGQDGGRRSTRTTAPGAGAAAAQRHREGEERLGGGGGVRVSRLRTRRGEDAADGDRGAARRHRSSRSGSTSRCTAAGRDQHDHGRSSRRRRPRSSTDACWYLVRPVDDAGEEREDQRPHCAQRRADHGPAARTATPHRRDIGTERAPGRGPLTRSGERARGWHDRRHGRAHRRRLSPPPRPRSPNCCPTSSGSTPRTPATPLRAPGSGPPPSGWRASSPTSASSPRSASPSRAAPAWSPASRAPTAAARRCSCTATSTSCPPTRPSGACTRSPARSATATSGAAARST